MLLERLGKGPNMVDFKDLTPDQMEKARACKTPDELLELARQEGYELSDED